MEHHDVGPQADDKMQEKTSQSPLPDRRRFLRGGVTAALAGAATYAAPRVVVAASTAALSPGALPLDLNITWKDVVSPLSGSLSGNYLTSGGFRLFIATETSCTLSNLHVHGSPASGQSFGPYTLQQTAPVAADCSVDGSTLVVKAVPPMTASIASGCEIHQITFDGGVEAKFAGGKIVSVTTTIGFATCFTCGGTFPGEPFCIGIVLTEETTF
jgi:hypothetical protein